MTVFAVGLEMLCFPLTQLVRYGTAVLTSQQIPSLMDDIKAVDLTWGRLIIWNAPLGGLFVLQYYLYMYGLSKAAVSTAVVIWNSSIIGVYLLSVLFLKEKVAVQKIAAIGLCLGGVTLIAFASDKSPHDESKHQQLLGIIAVVISATFYAIFAVMFSFGLGKSEEKVSVSNLCISLQGLSGFLIGIPFLFLLDHVGAPVEHFELPLCDGEWCRVTAYFLITETLTFLMNYFFVIGLVVLSPLIVSLAAMLTMPTSAVTDVIIHHENFSYMKICGTLGVVIGFALMISPEPKFLKIAWNKLRNQITNKGASGSTQTSFDAEQQVQVDYSAVIN
eukprot:TRINITY_DN21983_c0_g1_i1.p1 TRINITY_DN21983_c0_g1~~TRINITY_DN21983_c0_g1_i1.p1  ORF type:complete len:340 (-),score=41.30 TRINITY_DN21983_c0_g1_i1:223-1221(-)